MTATKQVPEWLNLDAIMTAEQRDEVVAITQELLAIAPQFIEAAGRAKALYHICADGVEGDTLELVHQLSSIDEIEEVLHLLEGEVGSVTEGNTSPEFLAKLRTKYGFEEVTR